MVKTIKIITHGKESTRQYSVTIPKAVIEAMSWKKGQELEVVVKGKGKIEFREV